LAIARGLAGVGLWTLDSDARGLLASSVRSTFVTPVRRLVVVPSVARVRAPGGSVVVDIVVVLRNTGRIPERGVLSWRIVDSAGRTVGAIRRLVNIPVGARARITTGIGIGAAWARPAGTYRLLVAMDTRGRRWSMPAVSFRQPF
ncbi:MAG: hypothetical protein ACXVHC_06945, partial [Frankiaceae bacterium]